MLTWADHGIGWGLVAAAVWIGGGSLLSAYAAVSNPTHKKEWSEIRKKRSAMSCEAIKVLAGRKDSQLAEGALLAVLRDERLPVRMREYAARGLKSFESTAVRKTLAKAIRSKEAGTRILGLIACAGRVQADNNLYEAAAALRRDPCDLVRRQAYKTCP